MPRISKERQQDRRNSILAAGRTVLSARGFNDAAISAIAAEAGVSDGLVYRYFTNKRDLLIAVLADFYEGIIDNLEVILDQYDTFEERIRAIVYEHIARFASDKEMCELFLTEIRVSNNYGETEIFRLNRRYTSIVVRTAQDGLAKGEMNPAIGPRLLRDMLFGGIEHFAWRHIGKGIAIDVDDGARKIAEVLLHGVCARSANPDQPKSLTGK